MQTTWPVRSQRQEKERMKAKVETEKELPQWLIAMQKRKNRLEKIC
jgi:hypothetical protein